MLAVKSEHVHAEVLSVAPLEAADRLAAIGRTLDAFPEYVPTKMGPNDPPRTPVTTVEEIVREHWQDTGRGSRAPTYEDHRRFVAGG